MSSQLAGSRTEANLRAAFTLESESNRRYLYLAQRAEVDGRPEAAAVLRSVAEGGTGHAFGLYDFLVEVVDPATGRSVESTEDGLAVAEATERHKHAELYPEFARVARDEGFDEIAEWLETMARADGGSADRLAVVLGAVSDEGPDGVRSETDGKTDGETDGKTDGEADDGVGR